MSKQLDAAIENLTTTYQSLAQAAASYVNTLDAKEVASALLKAKPDTAEYIALVHLNDLLTRQKPAPAPVVEEVAAPQE